MEVGAKVKVKRSGCDGTICIRDDSELPFKVLLTDGSADWFRAVDLQIVTRSDLLMAAPAMVQDKDKGTMHVAILGIGGYLEDSSFFLEITVHATVGELKRLIFQKMGRCHSIQPRLQSLILGEVPLQDDHKLLKEYGMEDGDTIVLIKSQKELNLSFSTTIIELSSGFGRFDWEPDWTSAYDVSVAPASAESSCLLESLAARGRQEMHNRGSSSFESVEQKPVSWLLAILEQEGWKKALDTKADDAEKLLDLVWAAGSTLQCRQVTTKSGLHGGFADRCEGELMEILIDGHMIKLEHSYTPNVTVY